MIITVSLLVVGIGNQAFAQVTDPVKVTDPVAILETNLGEIAISFFPQDAPNHVQNFIQLSQSGFYDGTIFHRIIPGFMIQGGDPNTIDGDPNTWGTGGPAEQVDAEFNTIKHNRGIVSMARSTDPDSAGSQFFIVHKDSSFLDEKYTVFGRIVTEESFETLDKIASVKTGTNDRPVDPTQVQIAKVTIVPRSDISNLINMDEPERITSVVQFTENKKFESTEHEIALSFPEGWLLQSGDGQENAPDVFAVGPKLGKADPSISLTVQQTNSQPIDDLISQKTELITQLSLSDNIKILSQEKTHVNGNQALSIIAEREYLINNENIDIKFKEISIFDTEKIYILAYSNDKENFDSQLSRFDETINSFEILAQDATDAQIEDFGVDDKEKESCLIATAAYGTELAPQVQFLREIRDNTVLTTQSGMTFMTGFNALYYSFAPTVADWERENPMFQEAVRAFITPMISSLSIMSLAEGGSESEVLGFGISVIVLNLGMYIAAPALIGFQIHKQIKSRK